MATYKVQSGDTLSKIAQSQGVKVSDISGYKSGNPDQIFAGENLTIGGGATPKTGIVTSDNATAKAKSINETINSITKGISNLPGSQGVTPVTDPKTGKTTAGSKNDPFAALYGRINVLQANLNTAKENERIAKEAKATQEMQDKLGATRSAEEVGKAASADLSAATTAIGNAGKGMPTDTSTIEDPIIRGLTDKNIANVGILQQQMSTLENYRQQHSDYTQQDIDSIARTAERSVTRQLAENERTKRAMEFAGVVGGRAQFAPVTQESIIHEVVQEGLDKVELINEKKNTAIREARKAESEFNLEAFEQYANLAKEYNDEMESTFSEMNKQVRQVESDERDRIEFRQAQEERSSLVLAEELIDATPEKIMQTAAANGIDYGLLTKAVNDAKFAKQSQDLDIQSKRESILSSQESRRLDQARYDREGKKTSETSDFSKEESALLRQAGLDGATYDEKVTFLNMTPSERSVKIKEVQDTIKEDENTPLSEFISNLVGSSSAFKGGEFPDRLKASAKNFGINPKGVFNDKEARNFLGTIAQNLKTTYPEISDTEIKEYLKQIPADATAEEITAYLQFARKGI